MSLPDKTIEILRFLEVNRIRPLLYGSQGVSLYIGKFKDFSDTDVLVDEEWITKKWDKLIRIMESNGFKLSDPKEHEFTDKKGVVVAFASNKIIVRDQIAKSIEEAIVRKTYGDYVITTLGPKFFLRTYEFSSRDGYRKENRNKKDNVVIELLNEYLRLNN